MADTSMRFGLLGQLTVSVAGSCVELKSERQRALLAALVLRAGHAVSRARLVEVLWQEPQPDDPRAALQTQVMRLRRALGAAG